MRLAIELVRANIGIDTKCTTLYLSSFVLSPRAAVYRYTSSSEPPAVGILRCHSLVVELGIAKRNHVQSKAGRCRMKCGTFKLEARTWSSLAFTLRCYIYYWDALLQELTTVEVLVSYTKLICYTQDAKKLFDSSGLWLMLYESLNVKTSAERCTLYQNMFKMSPCWTRSMYTRVQTAITNCSESCKW